MYPKVFSGLTEEIDSAAHRKGVCSVILKAARWVPRRREPVLTLAQKRKHVISFQKCQTAYTIEGQLRNKDEKKKRQL